MLYKNFELLPNIKFRKFYVKIHIPTFLWKVKIWTNRIYSLTSNKQHWLSITSLVFFWGGQICPPQFAPFPTQPTSFVTKPSWGLKTLGFIITAWLTPSPRLLQCLPELTDYASLLLCLPSCDLPGYWQHQCGTRPVEARLWDAVPVPSPADAHLWPWLLLHWPKGHPLSGPRQMEPGELYAHLPK